MVTGVGRGRKAVVAVLTADVVVLAVTGVVLFFTYRPAYEGGVAERFGHDPGGSYDLARAMTGLHRVAGYGALPLAVAAAVLIALERWPGDRRRQRRGAIAVGTGLVVTVLLGSFSGLLLAWDQIGLWAVTVGEDWSGYERLLLDADRVRFVIVDGREVALGTLVPWLAVHTIVVGAVLGALLATAWRRQGRQQVADLVTEPPPAERVPA